MDISIEVLQKQLPIERKLCIGDSNLPLALGYKFDEINQIWYIYENDEKGKQMIRYNSKSEEEIVDIFYQLVQLEIKKFKKYLEWNKK
ncbi:MULTISPECIES: hypothetical protein [Streptococcus]|uniref:hypothetical protein n=1 Tax=Streptococcus TaxID=1301 RepID=UPI0012DC912B|nr:MULTISPECIES: hypothetical protein [Streptococcus]QHF54397.1 hypothetical protein BZG42_03080 [Streptococcus sp. DAT741]